jgi:hypothetical protein
VDSDDRDRNRHRNDFIRTRTRLVDSTSHLVGVVTSRAFTHTRCCCRSQLSFSSHAPDCDRGRRWGRINPRLLLRCHRQGYWRTLRGGLPDTASCTRMGRTASCGLYKNLGQAVRSALQSPPLGYRHEICALAMDTTCCSVVALDIETIIHCDRHSCGWINGQLHSLQRLCNDVKETRP